MVSQKQVSSDDVLREFNKAMSGADQLRADGLDRLHALRTVKDASLRREEARLTRKLGANHPRVKEIRQRLKVNSVLMRDLALESKRARVEPPEVDNHTWCLHGFVRNKSHSGVPNLTVALFDQAGSRLDGLGHGCTDANGYFKIRSTNLSNVRAAYVRVFSQQGSVLYADSSALQPRAGVIDYREIILSGEDVVCIPPPEPVEPTPTPGTGTPGTGTPGTGTPGTGTPGTGTPGTGTPGTGTPGTGTPASGQTPAADQPPPGTWVVKGRVTDQANKGVAGVFVSVYDKDLFFDDRLGQAMTDNNGNYSLTYQTDDFRDLIEKRPDLYLKVIDNKGNTVHTRKGRTWFEAGRVETIDIQITKRD
jgi:hypothetical protein